MNLILKNITITDPLSSYNGTKNDIHIHEGKIKAIAQSIHDANATQIDATDWHISPGFFDIGAHLGEPGYEHQETITTGLQAATIGGYTGVAVMPNTQPIADTKSVIQFIQQQANNPLVDVYVIGALTQQTKGEVISEMYDMHQAGAIAFSDGKKSIQHAGVLLRALQYVRPINSIVIQQAIDNTIAEQGMMHEGHVSASLGLKGIPAIAENIMVHRDIELCKYAQSKLLFYNVHTTQAVALIHQSKTDGVEVSSSINPLHLLLNDEHVASYDSAYKLMPPLVNKTQQEQLKIAFANGQIDAITSGHTPQHIEHKQVDFYAAAFGALGLQHCFSTVLTAFGGTIQLATVINALSIRPRQILQVEVPIVSINQVCNFVCYHPNEKYIVHENDICSIAKNTPLIGMELTGKVKLVIKNNILHQL